jgi:hypothetical protein
MRKIKLEYLSMNSSVKQDFIFSMYGRGRLASYKTDGLNKYYKLNNL